MDCCQHHDGASLGLDSYKWRSVSFYFCVMGTCQCFLNEGRGAANKSSRSNVAHSTALLSRSIVNVLCPDVLCGTRTNTGETSSSTPTLTVWRISMPKSTSWSGLRNVRNETEDLNCVSLPSQMQLNPKRYRNMKTLECKNLKLLKYKVQNGRTFRMSLRLLFSASQSLNNNYQLHLASLLSWHWRKLSFSGMLTFKRKKRPLAKNSIPLGILIY